MHAPARRSYPPAVSRAAALFLEPATFGPLMLALLAPMLVLYLPAEIWTANEEHYFQLALRRVAPELFSPWHAAFDSSQGRIVGEYLFGTLVQFAGYESAHALARGAMAVLYAGSLAALFASIRFSIVEALFVVALFRLLGEQILGAEWLFDGVESKTIAYALVFIAIALASRHRWTAAFAACAAAAWLHFLVGGLWGVLLAVGCAWAQRGQWRRVLGAFATFLLLVAPLLVILARDQLSPGVPAALVPIDGSPMPSADQIYAWRNSHHLSPFLDESQWPHWMRGIAWLCIASMVLAIAASLRPPVGILVSLAAVGLGELFVAIAISYLDQSRLLFAKLYLFRPSSLTLLLIIAIVLAAIRDRLPRRAQPIALLVMAGVILRCLQLEMWLERYALRMSAGVPQQAELIAAVHGASQPFDVVAFEPYADGKLPYISLHRLIGRPTVVAPKFVPTNPHDLQRWYALLVWRKQLFETGCASAQQVPVRLLVTFSGAARQRLAGCGPVVWLRGDTALIRVDR